MRSASLSRAATDQVIAAITTIPMQARKGRASYLRPHSVGHEGPGAACTALILGALRDAARTGR